MKRASLTWLEVSFNDAVSGGLTVAFLERLATQPSLGTLVLEANVEQGHPRWLIGTSPSSARQVRLLVGGLLQVPVTSFTGRRPELEDAAQVRLSHATLSLSVERMEASSRAVLAALSGVRPAEVVTVQLVLGGRLSPTLSPETGWLEALCPSQRSRPQPSAAVVKGRGQQHGFRSQVRIGVSAGSPARCRELVDSVFAGMRVAEQAGAHLSLLREAPSRVNRAAHPWRYPLRLRSGELAGLLGWPIGTLPLPLVGGLHPKRLAPRRDLPQRPTRLLGVLDDTTAKPHPVGLGPSDALRGLYLLGPTGSGKSTVLLNLITADMQAGRSLLLIDPKGDLAVDVLARVPEVRLDDVVVIDPTSASPVGLNPLHVGRGQSAEIVADTLLATFRDLYASSWGVRTADVLSTAFLSLARIPGANLLWVAPLMSQPGFRHHVLAGESDRLGTGAFWAQYEALTPAQQAAWIGPVLNKLRTLLLRPSLRAVVGQSTPKFDLGDLLTKPQIVVVTTNKGLMGPETSRLIGSLILSQLWPLILARTRLPVERRRFTAIYLDEVQEVIGAIPGDLSDALAMSRSQGVAWTMAHQLRVQLSEQMRQAIDGNARSKVVFGLGDQDAAAMSKLMRALDPEDLQALPPFHAYANLMNQGGLTGWFSMTTSRPVPALRDASEVKARSEARYGIPAQRTETELIARLDRTDPLPGDRADGPIGRRRAS